MGTGADGGEQRRQEFDAFYAATAPRLVTVVHALTGDRAEAEDAVQEAYARAWERWPKLCAGGDPAPWVRTVALRLAVSTWRKARNRLRAHFRHGPPPDVPAVAPDHVALIDALRTLPVEQRTAVVLHHLLGLPTAEVARETGASDAAVRARLSRARKALRAQLGEERGAAGRGAPGGRPVAGPRLRAGKGNPPL
ncbi:SigE family RNA polymerase sigma factor [Streptomyces aidingensis]|uniref:RNA polymerase sigma-70 factor, ECF subfamily n=1 Tax=Streptomyces aidingensis TaxID=910347 RepID=A0A1I1STF4_9ACTN|nr:SigE family RNA polymerase sigma factor [Streptomyces aidingensis]SFD49727.1 RNA polymerase sigma-70 factor, ECF subfamily [Streptomyces aidingensis]